MTHTRTTFPHQIIGPLRQRVGTLEATGRDHEAQIQNLTSTVAKERATRTELQDHNKVCELLAASSHARTTVTANCVLRHPITQALADEVAALKKRQAELLRQVKKLRLRWGSEGGSILDNALVRAACYACVWPSMLRLRSPHAPTSARLQSAKLQGELQEAQLHEDALAEQLGSLKSQV